VPPFFSRRGRRARGTAGGAARRERFNVLRLLRRHALAIFERFLGRLVGVQGRVDLNLRLSAPSVWARSCRASPPSSCRSVLRRPVCRLPRSAFAVLRGPQQRPVPSVIVTFDSSRPGTDEATSCAMPRTDAGSIDVVPVNRTAASWRSGFLRTLTLALEGQLDLGAGDAWMLSIVCASCPAARADMSLLLKVAFAEARFFKQRESRLGVASRPNRERNARLACFV